MPSPTPEPQLVMRRESLAELPAVAFPEGYRLRSFVDGDEAVWESIIGESFEWSERAGKFDAVMRRDPAFRAERVLFVCEGDRPLATASAWHRAAHGPGVGYLHYVGVLPSHQGRRLGYQVSLACLHAMVGEGRSSAVLQTDDFRVPAIRTYFNLGFVPRLVHENQRRRWREVLEGIDRADWTKRCEGALAAPIVREE